MNRRKFVRIAGFLAGSAFLMINPSDLLGVSTSSLDRFKIGVISDGFSHDFRVALKIMKSYGLSWVENGVAKAGMGVDAADVNGHGWPDFVMTAFDSEYHFPVHQPWHFPFRRLDRPIRVGASDQAICRLGNTLPRLRQRRHHGFDDRERPRQ